MKQSYINHLRSAYSPIKTCSVENYQRLKGALGKLPTCDVEKIANADIRFVSTAANSVLCDRGERPESARWDRAVEVIADSILAEHTKAKCA